jgi:DDE_Tnp_1-associated/Transposase DDE domain
MDLAKEGRAMAKQSLLQAFESVPDSRDAQGRRYLLSSLLTLATVAIFSGATGPSAIAQFGRERGAGFAAALGIARGTLPCCSTLHYVFAGIDLAAFGRVLRRWIVQRFAGIGEAIDFDGKLLRGTQGHQRTGTMLATAYARAIRAVLAQVPLNGSTNEHKKALQLLNMIPLEGKVVVGDAMYCQRDLSAKVLKRKGNYLWAVKDNQKRLHQDIAAALDPNAEKDFSPSRTPGRQSPAAKGQHPRQGARPNREAHADEHHRTQ